MPGLRIDVAVVLLEWTVGRTRLRLDYSFFWILTFAAWAQNELLWQVLLFSVLHECGHLTVLCALGLQPRQLRLSFYGMALRYDRVPSLAADPAPGHTAAPYRKRTSAAA